MILITKLRTELGWSKSKLSRESEMNNADISRIELHGLRPFDIQLKRIAKALKYPEGKRNNLVQEVKE